MDLKKTNYFDPRKMAARKRWTVQETGQGLIAMTGYAYLGDEEKTALFSGADLEARIRQASAEKPREMELYLRLSNWLVIRRRETLQLKSHAMTGWRMGYVCGPAPILQQMLKLLNGEIQRTHQMSHHIPPCML